MTRDCYWDSTEQRNAGIIHRRTRFRRASILMLHAQLPVGAMTYFDCARQNLYSLLAVVACCCLFGKASADQALLYDPEPPVDSAYLRIIHTGAHKSVDVHIDGRLRVNNLHADRPSDYVVLSPGKHELTLRAAGKSQIRDSTALTLESGQSVTIAYDALHSSEKPLIFNDKINANKLKAVLSVYNLDGKDGAFDILTADGKTAVFSGIAPEKSMTLSVNPVSAELILTNAGNKVARARIPIAMMAGATYSILLLPGAGGTPLIHFGLNKTERYKAQ